MSIHPPQNGSYYTKNDPAMDKYRPAWDTLKANSFVNDPNLSEFDRIYLRGIQGTWKVKQEIRADHGYSSQIMLIWDHDRIWGAFNFGAFKGILMVDHGPQHEPFKFPQEQYDAKVEDNDRKSIYHDFVWRGRCTYMPDTIINNPLITKGKIEFGSTWICGYFEGMDGNGLQIPNIRRDFDGNALFGPRRVPRNLQSFIDDWNDLGILEEDEKVRLAASSGANKLSSYTEGI